jgi:predicted RNase H-like nuclease
MAGKVSQDAWVAGVDGCRCGWLVAFARSTGGEIRLRIVPRFAEVLAAPEKPRIVAVDIPIGLPEHSEIKGRGPERVVRPLLGMRRSSVFRVPSRAAVDAGVDASISDDKERYLTSCAIARATSLDKKAFGKQSFYLFPKIVEVDTLLRAQKQPNGRFFEIHPELAFWRLNADRALDEPKKRKGRCHEPGLALRRRLLVEAGLPANVVNGDPPKGAGADDLLDALACTAIARRIHAKCTQPFPDPFEPDAFGLRMAIWA